MSTQLQDLIKFNVERDARLNIAYEGESNRTIIEFEGWEMHDPANALLLIWNGAFDRYIPIINNRMLVTAKLASEAGEAVCCLEERNSEQEFVAKSSTFTVKVLPSPKASEEVEVIDDRLELVYEEYNKKYQEMVALESEIQTNDSERQSQFEAVKESIEDIRADLQQKVEEGYFNGKDGISPTATVTKSGKTTTITITDKNGTTTAQVQDGADGNDYVITEADKREIAGMVEPYNDGPIREEIAELDEAVGSKAEQSEVNEIREDVSRVSESLNQKADKSELDETSAKLDALWKLNQGQTYDFYEDTNDAYEVAIPSGAKWMDLKKIGGNSVVWNQLCGDNYTIENGATATKNGNEFIFSNTVDTASIAYTVPVITGNKYFVAISIFDNYVFQFSMGTTLVAKSTSGLWTKNEGILTPISNRNYVYIYPNITVNPKVTNAHLKDISIINLTQMFGAGNEPTSVDDERIKHIEEYALAHPEYNEGEIISSQTDEVVVRGSNLLDVTDFSLYPYGQAPSKIFGFSTQKIGNKINISGTSTNTVGGLRARWYSIPPEKYNADLTYGAMYDGNVIVASQIERTANSYNVILDLKKKVETGEYYYFDIYPMAFKTPPTAYKPYHEPLIISTNFPVLRSAGNVYDYIDFDRSVIVRRVGVVDLGTIRWSIYNGDFFTNDFSQPPMPKFLNAICSKYPNYKGNRGSAPDKSFAYWNDSQMSQLGIKDSDYTDATTFRTSLNGVMLYYELATPTYEPITLKEPYEDIEVEGGGSITYVSNLDAEGLHVPVTSTNEYIRKLNEV